MKVSDVAQMRRLDRSAMERYGIPEQILMENAGEAVYFVILSRFGIRGRRFVVFCGLGNNGGDGFVVARKIHSSAGAVKVFVLGDCGKFRGAAENNLEMARRVGLPVREIDSVDAVRHEVLHCDAVVDAIFGTGLMRQVQGLHRDVIACINSAGKTVFSVDIPSGVHGDTGKIMGVAVKADHTVTFGLPKIGNMLFPGYAFCGKLHVTHISFPPAMYEAEALKVQINLPPLLPARPQDGHKGNFGQVLFIAGAVGYFGAPYFAALSFLKAGGGYSRLAAPRSITPFIAAKGSEIVFVPQQETAGGSIALKNKSSLLELAEKMDMVVLGPGLSLDGETQGLAKQLAAQIRRPLLLDGDGITALSANPEILRGRQGGTVLTPHLGEMSRLTGLSTADIDERKVEVLQAAAKDLSAVVVLKGAHSLVGYPDQRVFINLSGNCGMATAGSGDVLTGAVAAMYGLGLPLEDATRKGVFLHGLAGDLAAAAKGEDGITAQDILEALSAALRLDRQGLDEEVHTRYFGPELV